MAPVEHENYIFAAQRRQSERFTAGLGQGEIRRGLAGLYAIRPVRDPDRTVEGLDRPWGHTEREGMESPEP